MTKASKIILTLLVLLIIWFLLFIMAFMFGKTRRAEGTLGVWVTRTKSGWVYVYYDYQAWPITAGRSLNQKIQHSDQYWIDKADEIRKKYRQKRFINNGTY